MKTFIIVALLAIGGVAYIANAYESLKGYAVTPSHVFAPPHPASQTHSVVYQIQTSGCTDFDTTYAMADGTSQSSSYTCSTTEVAHFQAQSGQFVSLSIQNAGDYNASASATFSCIIQVDGLPFKAVRSSGSYHIASCDGTVP